VEIKTKQRMIGTVIIVLILLILVPLLFSNSKQPNDESTVEQTTAIATQPEVNPDQQSIPADQPQINADQSQSAIAEQPETYDNTAPSTPQENSQLSAPVQSPEQQPKPEENINVPNSPIAVPATDNQQSVPKITTPIKVATETSADLTDVKPLTTANTKNWSVQLGIFSQKNNATHLVNKLKAGGFEVHLKELSASTGKTYRVFVGNNYNRNKAQKIAYNLNKIYHLKGVVVSN
jgi:cell division septation protein DedD